MSKYRHTAEEALALIDDDTDLANLCAGDIQLEDAESDDGDVEEADYISATGRAELVPLSARGSGMTTGMFEEDEPALRDSLLLLDTDLEDLDHDTSMEVVVPENNSDHENSPTPSVRSPGVSDPNDSVTDDDHDIYSPPQPRRRRGGDVGSTRGRAMRARAFLPSAPPLTVGQGSWHCQGGTLAW